MKKQTLFPFLLILASADAFSTSSTRPTLALLTFDLDDTLFPCGPVVAEANEAMIASIVSHGYPSITNEDVLAATKAIRNELRKTDTPITYTNLRIAAIQSQLERSLALHNPDLGSNALHESVSQKIFEVWLRARHQAAERNLYPDVIAMLRQIQAAHPDAIIGAVTNGRGDPLDMRETLRPYFDFTISGEDDGVFPNRKPHPGIFEATLSRFESIAGYDVMEREDRCWVHVGDDLANDVGASAACGAKAVWYKMEEEDDDATPFYSTASSDEIERRKRMAKEAEEKVTERISTLGQLPDAIENILSPATVNNANPNSNALHKRSSGKGRHRRIGGGGIRPDDGSAVDDNGFVIIQGG